VTGLRVLVGVWCVFWMFLTLFDVFLIDACAASTVLDPATCEQTIGVGLLVVIVALIAVLAVALVFSNPDRPSRTQAMALTLGAVAPIVLFAVLTAGGFYAAR
jgi:hypothetical protein